jgi:hypothetical protein
MACISPRAVQTTMQRQRDCRNHISASRMPGEAPVPVTHHADRDRRNGASPASSTCQVKGNCTRTTMQKNREIAEITYFLRHMPGERRRYEATTQRQRDCRNHIPASRARSKVPVPDHHGNRDCVKITDPASSHAGRSVPVRGDMQR